MATYPLAVVMVAAPGTVAVMTLAGSFEGSMVASDAVAELPMSRPTTTLPGLLSVYFTAVPHGGRGEYAQKLRGLMRKEKPSPQIQACITSALIGRTTSPHTLGRVNAQNSGHLTGERSAICVRELVIICVKCELCPHAIARLA